MANVVEAGTIGGRTDENRFSKGVRWQIKFGKQDTFNFCRWMYALADSPIRGALNYDKLTWYAKTYPWVDGRKRPDKDRKASIPIPFVRG
jgi:hypothetical protein